MIIKDSNKKDILLSYFLTFPTTEYHLRELSRTSNISLPWVRKITDQFKKNNLITKEHKHNLILIKANTDSKEFKVLKRAHNQISLTDLIDYLIKVYNHPEAIILFGSYEKGQDTENSDIDIAIITKRKAKPILKKFETQLCRKISIKELSRIEKEFLETLANGTVLSGYLELP